MRRNHTSLWAVIEGMQKRLEAEGLESEVVDVAVTRGIELLLRRRPANGEGEHRLVALTPVEA